MEGESAQSRLKVNINKPRYDQCTYIGRAKHFFIVTNPLNLFATSSQLEESRRIVEAYRNGESLPGLTEDKLWQAKHLYDSTFHPDTKKKMFPFGRMSAQVPCNMTITGCMLTFYRTTPAVIFWQWINQSFNAIVNYTNRSGDSPIDMKTLFMSYAGATSGAIVTALSLNKLAPRFPPMAARFVPFAAVAAANAVNIPMMRSSEIINGLPVFTEDGERVGTSSKAAQSAISQVVVSRIVMAMPSMFIPPVFMARLERGQFLKKNPRMAAPIQVLMVGAVLIFSTPLCCALFPQTSSIKTLHVEADLRDQLMKRPNPPERLYFNKGL